MTKPDDMHFVQQKAPNGDWVLISESVAKWYAERLAAEEREKYAAEAIEFRVVTYRRIEE